MRKTFSQFVHEASASSPNTKPWETSKPPAAAATTPSTQSDEPKTSPTLSDLRTASAQATAAGPSKEAQALMSQRTKNILGPQKLASGIAGQERVQAMKSEVDKPATPVAKPTPTVSGKGTVLAKKDGVEGTLNKATGQFTARNFDKSQTDRYNKLRGSNQLKTDSQIVKSNQIIRSGAVKALSKTDTVQSTQAAQKSKTTSQTAPAPKRTGLSDEQKKRIDDFRKLGPLEKLKQKSAVEKEINSLDPETKQQVMDYYNR